MASGRAAPVIIQLIITYVIIAFIVRAVRRARKAAPSPPKPGAGAASRTLLSTGRPPSPAPLSGEPSPRDSAVRREEVMFGGVRWQVTFRPHRDLSPEARVTRHDVYVEEPPRCPKCGLGVVETRSWLGYTWSCPECGLRKRSSKSIQAVAQALARGLH